METTTSTFDLLKYLRGNEIARPFGLMVKINGNVTVKKWLTS